MGEYAKIDDLNVIREMGIGLGRIKEAFDGLGKLKGQYEDDFGEHDLAWQFGDFVENWESHREELGEEVKRLGEIAKTAAKTYETIDSELAKALREADKKKKRA
ncbi:hypothetical protein ACH4D5_37975 [Streptomyces sp. NPDC018029]|uniref:hypothetical protein n=1 Tax=Streptomyces sp. NPDC018029 TaxID=3365032 RepID=UPI0037885F89